MTSIGPSSANGKDRHASATRGLAPERNGSPLTNGDLRPPHPCQQTIPRYYPALNARKSAKHHRIFFEMGAVAMAYVSPVGRILEVNQAYCELTGYSLAELIDMDVLDLTHPDDREEDRAHFYAYLREECSIYSSEKRYLRKDGAVRWVHVTGRLLYDDDGCPCYSMGIIQDITARKLAEESLAHAYDQLEARVCERTAELERVNREREQLQKELLRISEREKQLIAQELHDGLCQHLAGTALMGSLLQRRLAAKQDSEAEYARQICGLLNTGVNEARNLSHGLHPVRAGAGGLEEALCQLAKTITTLFHIGCSFQCPEPVDFDNDGIGTNLFRIAQEAVNNAMKHGQASRVIITLERAGAEVVLSIRDNGVGIPRKLPATGGMGMQIMKHRAATIGARLEVSRAGRKGTLVRCAAPA